MKEIKFYSIGRGSLNLNGKFYYGLDYSITDFMNSLEQENKKYKEVIDKAINDLNIIIDIVREQPFGDRWIINRLEANKRILKEVE